MKITNWIGAGTGLAFLGAFALSPRTEAWTTIGGFLDLNQRDFRVFNNFTDPTANDNNVPHPNFPGATGAAMAIWKAYVEWGSRLHGNGDGDSHQPFGLGSGGANFDPSWQGMATTTGDTNSNIVSQISGSSGGTLAYTETPIGDGWRIRFLQDAATWNDGPTTPSNHYDIQGVACHEFGHALGLGHSGDGGATMVPGAAQPAVTQRSINADDIAGVQAVYGVALPTKPIISGITTAPGQVTITGSNFSASGNEVWFTPTAVGGTGVPVKAFNVPSNGTQMFVTVPAGAGPGDVLVRIPGTTNDKLSNAWPFTPNTDPICPVTSNVCFAAPNTVSPFGSLMSSLGSQQMSQNNFQLLASDLPPGTSGLFYFGNTEVQVAFGNGYRCVGSPVLRLPVIQASIFGDAAWLLDFNSGPALGNITPGSVKYFQFWYRNVAAGGAGFNLSDALRVPFCP
jgi:hypothetical protein